MAELRKAGKSVVFLTNNSSQRLDAYVQKLARQGVQAEAGEVVSSAVSAATLVRATERVFVCGGEGVVEALEKRGVEVVSDTKAADVVIVGWHRDFDFDKLAAAMQAVRGGARLIGTNDDATFPSEDGLLPGAGSILAAVSVASGVSPQVAGKPHQTTVDLLRSWSTPVEMVVGDRPSTDGLLAQRLGVPFALVRSGVTPPGADPGMPTAIDAADLAAAVHGIIGGDPEVLARKPTGEAGNAGGRN